MPAGSKPPAAGRMCISTERETRPWRFSAFVDQGVVPAKESRRFGHHAEAGRTRRAVIDLPCTRSPRSSLDILQRPPYACESWCLVLRLPPWHDVATELHTQDLLNVDLSISSSPYVRPTVYLLDRNGSSLDSAVYRIFL